MARKVTLAGQSLKGPRDSGANDDELRHEALLPGKVQWG